MKILLIAALVLAAASIANAAEPSSEQLQLMREYGLSVPPVILDKNGHDRSTVSEKTTDRLPDLANDALSPAEKSKEIIAEFGPAIPFELPLKRPVVAEILADVVGVEYVDDTTAKEKIETRPGLVFVDFYATWCVPCIRMATIVESMADEFKQVKFTKVDIDIATTFSRRMNIGPDLPRFMLMENGKILATKTGACLAEELSAWISSNSNQPALQAQSIPAAYREVQHQLDAARAWRSCGRGAGRR